jgi:hypothetical protein
LHTTNSTWKYVNCQLHPQKKPAAEGFLTIRIQADPQLRELYFFFPALIRIAYITISKTAKPAK